MTRHNSCFRCVLALSILVFLAGCQAPAPATAPSWVAEGHEGMVASDSVYASQAGLKILRAGGNAVDAAAATSFALAVTRPYSMGLGGGGFMIVRLAKTGEVFVLDYRERAPQTSTPDMFVQARKKDPRGPAPSQYGGLAVGIPGHVAGHAALLERLGTRGFGEVLEPAVQLAAEGFAVDTHYCDAVADTLKDMKRTPALAQTGQALKARLLFGGKTPAPGALLRQPELANTLRQIQTHGQSAFYSGPIAQALVDADRAAGGILTLEDLQSYRPTWRESLRIAYRDRYELLLMPPPSSGGICIAETLNILEHWDLAAALRHDPSLAAHLTVEALKQAFADRARHLGDADFSSVPVKQLTSKDYAKTLAARIREHAACPAGDAGTPLKDAGTSHFCVVDRWGNVVACTETINTTFGSLVVAESAGVVLNNEMDDFTAEPGKANAFGLTQSDKNTVAPGKRPLSSMSPTIVLENNRPVLAIGASGGPVIITATLEVMLDVLDYRQPLSQAIAQPRFHHQWNPNLLYRNQLSANSPIVAGLKHRGHKVSSKHREAVVQAIQIDGQRLIGASDPRKGGQPAGY